MKPDLPTFWCPKCGVANLPQALLCVGCAERLAPRYMAEGQTQVCPTCGTENPLGAGFCRTCGTPLPEALEQRQSLSQSAPPPSARPQQPPPGQSRLSRLAQARLAKEQNQPKTESSGDDWFGSLRSEAAAIPIPEHDEEEDEEEAAASAMPEFTFEPGEEAGTFEDSLRANLSGGTLDLFGEPPTQPADFSPVEDLRSRPMTAPLFAPESMTGPLLTPDSAEALPLFDMGDSEQAQTQPAEPPAPGGDFDPRRGATGFLPDWLRELNPADSASSPSVSGPEDASASSVGRPPQPFVPGEPEEPFLGSSLQPFELDESKSIDGGREVQLPTTEEIGGVPDWLKEITNRPGQLEEKRPEEPPEWLKDLENQRTTKPNIEGDMPTWLRDISAQSGGPKAPGRPTFGDEEVAAELAHAFGDDENKPFGDSDELPDMNLPPGFAKTLPPEAFKTGLTAELGEMPPLPKGIEIPSYLQEAEQSEPEAESEAMPPLPALDNLFVEETPQGEEIPFSLPPLPDFGQEEETPSFALPFENETAPASSANLPPWLQGLPLPTLEAEPELPEFSFPVIGVPEEDLGGYVEDPQTASATPGRPADEADVAAIFDEVATNPPNQGMLDDLLNASKTDGSMRFKETRPFSLRDVLKQTDSLAGKMDFVDEAEQRQQQFGEEMSSAPATEQVYNDAEPASQPGSAFSISDFDATDQPFAEPQSEEMGYQPSAGEPQLDDLPDWLKSQAPAATPVEPEPASEEVPDWFKSPAVQPENEELPAWFQSEATTQSDQPAPEELPDWLKSQVVADQPAETETPAWSLPEMQAEPTAEELPSWFQAEASAPAAEPAEEVPEWLRTQPSALEQEAAPSDEEVPEWLRPQTAQPENFEFNLPSAEDLPEAAEPAEPDFSLELPSFDLSVPEEPAPLEAAEAAPPAPKPLFVPPLPALDDEEVEEAELAPFDPTQFDSPAITARPASMFGQTMNLGEPTEEELPDWLKTDKPAEAPAPKLESLEAVTPAEPAAPPDEELPPWLAAMGQSGAGATAAPAPESAAPEEELPPWLAAMSDGQAPAATPPSGKPEPHYSSMFAGVSRAEEQMADLPDWLKDTATPAPSSAQPEATAPAAPGEDVEIDRLLQDLTAGPQADDNAPAEMPAWLRDQSAPAEPQFELPEDLPDWLKEDAAAAESNLELPIQTDRFTTDPHTHEAATAADGGQPIAPFTLGNESGGSLGFFDDVEGPAWLRNQAATPETQPAPSIPMPPTAGFEGGMATAPAPTALPGWLRTVGPTATEQETIAPPTEPFVIPSAFPEVNLPPQLASAEVLAALLNPVPAPVAVEVPKGEAAPATLRFSTPRLVNWILYGLLLLVTLGALFLHPFAASSIAVTSDVQNFYGVINNLKPDDKVLVVFDWEGDRSGEMTPMSQAVTQQIMKQRARLVTLSLNSQGPALASQITNEVATVPDYGNSGVYGAYGVKYLNLGWRPGNEAALRSLFNGLGDMNDYRQGNRAATYEVMKDINSLNDFNLVVVLTSDETSVRTWVEQFGIQSNIPLLYGTTAAVAPVARPYLLGPVSARSNISSNYPHVQGLLAGLNGSAQYQQLLKDNNINTDSKLNLDERLVAQSLAVIFLILVVLVANVVYVVRRRQ